MRSLQAECEQYRSTLSETVRYTSIQFSLGHVVLEFAMETSCIHANADESKTVFGSSGFVRLQESMLKVLQKSVEEGELALKSKISDAEEQRQAVRSSVMLDLGHGLFGFAVELHLLVFHAGPGSGEGPGGDDGENESRHTGYRTGSCQLGFCALQSKLSFNCICKSLSPNSSVIHS